MNLKFLGALHMKLKFLGGLYMKLKELHPARRCLGAHCSMDAQTLIGKAGDQFRRTGRAGVFLLEMPVCESGAETAAEIADAFCEQAIIHDRNVHSVSLLTLLSSPLSPEQMLGLISQSADKNDGVILIDDMHRYFYHEPRARMLLRRLVRLWGMTFTGTPLILKAPQPAAQHLMAVCPQLRSCAFVLLADEKNTEPSP